MVKIRIPKKIQTRFDMVVLKYNQESQASDYNEKINPIVGKLWWSTPNDVLWLYTTDNEEGYDGSQTQIGVKKDGTVVWGFQSHCSCYGYTNDDGTTKELEREYKGYELQDVSLLVMDIIKEKLELIEKELI